MTLQRIVFAAFLLFAIVPGAGLVAAPASAQAEQQSNSAYYDLFDAMQETSDYEAVFENTLAVIRREYANNPDMAAAEEVSPGLIEDVVEAMRPILAVSAERTNGAYRESMATLFRDSLSATEAAEIAVIFRNPAMQRVMGNVARSYSPDSVLSGIESKALVTEEQVMQDVESAAAKGLEEARAEDLATISLVTSSSAAWLKYAELIPQVFALRAKFENAQPTPQELTALDTAIEAVFAKRFPE